VEENAPGSKNAILAISRSIASTIGKDISANGWRCTLFHVLFEWPLVDPFLELTDNPRYEHPLESGAKRVPIYYTDYHRGIPDGDYRLIILTTGAGCIFGVTHLAGWSFYHPSHAEQILWRTMSIVMTGISLIIAMVVSIMKRKGSGPSGAVDLTQNLTFKVLPVLYICISLYHISRISLLVEGVISLRDLPATAKDTIQWIDYFPHIS
jgi:hypothetical protein